MKRRTRAVVLAAAAAGALALGTAAPAFAASPAPVGPGTSICMPVPAFFLGVQPAGGPLYGFSSTTWPPSSTQAIINMATLSNDRMCLMKRL